MGNKTALNSQRKPFNPHCLNKPHDSGIRKKVYEVNTSRVGKRAKEVIRKKLSFFSKGFAPMIKFNDTDENYQSNTQNNSLSNSDSICGNTEEEAHFRLPVNEQEDAICHQSICNSLNKDEALHTSPSWQFTIATLSTANTTFPHVDHLPRNWKDSLKPFQREIYGFSAKQVRYQELIYEIILTEQSYVDDLILVYKIYLKDGLSWDGLPVCLRRLFENVFQIIRIHLQLLKELRACQTLQHPVVSSISGIFRSFISRLDIYSSYFANFEKANNTIIESLKSQDELGVFITRRSLWKECRNLPLTAYLLTPIQRVMKYPLFFRALEECLLPEDSELNNIRGFLVELDLILRYFEKQKKESEDFIKLEDLASRITGLEGSTIRLAEQGRKLIYEGYLKIVPTSQTKLTSRFDDSSSALSFSSVPTLSRKNSSFSLSSKKPNRTYVFLFNDMIVCTKERSKRKTESKVMGPPPRKGSFYGPSPDTLFKITHAPGKITMVDRAVMREVSYPIVERTLSRRGSALFQSLKRYGSRGTDEDFMAASPEVSLSPATQSFNDMSRLQSRQRGQYQQQQLPQRNSTSLERHPQQFICAIASRNITNIHFETETPEEKEAWCSYMEDVISEHVDRNSSVAIQNENNFFSVKSQPNLSPAHSICSFESGSSTGSLGFSAPGWSGYCDVERMEIDDESDVSAEVNIIHETKENALTRNKSHEFLHTIMNEFGDSVWQARAPPGMSPYQIRQSFSNVGHQF